MRVGGVIPPGRAGVIMLAVAFAPLVLRKLKPVTRAVGEGLVKAGETLRRIAEDQGTATAATATNEAMRNPEETTKAGAEAADVPMESASPIGQEEIAEQAAVEATAEHRPPKRKPAPKPNKKTDIGNGPNPKRTRPKKP